jgi:hypothetical protein
MLNQLYNKRHRISRLSLANQLPNMVAVVVDVGKPCHGARGTREAYLVASSSLTIVGRNRRLQRCVLPIINLESDSPSPARSTKLFRNGDATNPGTQVICLEKFENLSAISVSLNARPVARATPAALGYLGQTRPMTA